MREAHNQQSKEPDAKVYQVHIVRKDPCCEFPILALPQVDLVLRPEAPLFPYLSFWFPIRGRQKELEGLSRLWQV